MTTPNELLINLRADFFTNGLIEVGRADAVVDAFVDTIEKIATDDFACVMDGGAMVTRYEGIAGLRDGWSDFLQAFETIKISPGETFETEDGILEYVRLTGKPKGVAAQVEQEAAAVWRMRGDRLAMVEFYTDRARARASAGLHG